MMSNGANYEADQYKDLPKISDGNTFLKELQSYGITTLGDSRLLLDQKGDTYTFSVDKQPIFTVEGSARFVQFKELLKTNEINKVTQSTQVDLVDVRYNTVEFRRKLDACKEFYKTQIKESNNQAFWLSQNQSGQEKTGYKITAAEAQNQLDIINDIEKRFTQVTNPKRYQSAELMRLERETTLPKLDAELNTIYNKMNSFSDYRADIATGHFEKVNTPPFGLTITSAADARKVRDILNKFNNQELKLNQYAADAVQAAVYAETLKSMEAYFETIINNPSAPYPYQFNAQQIAAINYFPALKQYITDLNPQQTQDQKNTGVNQSQNPDTQQNTPETHTQYTNAQEAFAKGGIKGVASFFLDKTNMSKEQKDNWSGVGNLAVTGGLIFLGWKALRTAFKALSKKGREELDKDGGRGWLWLPIAGTFASNALTGESPLALLNGGKGSEYLAGLFGGNKDAGKEQNPAVSQAVDTYTKGFTGISAIFGNATCGQVGESIEQRDGKMKLKPAFVETIISAAKGEPSNQEKQQAAQAIQLIGEDDPNGLIHTTLLAMNLDYNALKNSDNVDKPFKDRAANAIVRLSEVVSYMQKNGYNRINADQLDIIQDYIANKNNSNLSLNDLQQRLGDVFEDSAKAPDEATKNLRKTKIDKLNISDTEKQDLLKNIRSFWMEWPLSKDLKNLDIRAKGSYIEIGTYGNYTKIDIKNNTLVGLEDINKKQIKFESLYQTLKVANLTNRIFDLTKNNQNPVAKDPFNVSWIGQDIEYSNTKFWSNPVDRFNHMDITVASGGYGGALGKISPILETQKDGYVAYLNTRYNKPLIDEESKKAKEEAEKKKQEEIKKKQEAAKKNTPEKK